jgi:hypothetical protein
MRVYHAIINALDRYSEAHCPQNIDDHIDALITVAAELMAMYHDTKVRKFVVKREADKLVARVREFHAIGRSHTPH